MKRVLIMEDNISLAMEWSAAFELNHCDVTLCNNVDDAIGFLESEPFDLLITDLFVENQEGGLHLLRKLDLTANKGLPTIAVTGAKIPQSRGKDKNVFLESARILGASKYMQKPFLAAELVVMAQDLWDR